MHLKSRLIYFINYEFKNVPLQQLTSTDYPPKDPESIILVREALTPPNKNSSNPGGMVYMKELEKLDVHALDETRSNSPGFPFKRGFFSTNPGVPGRGRIFKVFRKLYNKELTFFSLT